MPPKAATTKDNGTSNAGNAHQKEDVVSIDDILFPKATVTRLAKSVLETSEQEKSQFILAKDSLTAIQRSSVVFISYLFHNALLATKEDNRKTTSALDVMKALKNTGFGSYLPILEDELLLFTEKELLKKLLKLHAGAQTAEGEEDDQDEEDDEEEEEKDDIKRTKTSSGTPKKSKDSVKKVLKNDDEEDESQEMDVEEIEDDDEDDEEDSEEEIKKLKPSQVLSQEHKELEGEDSETDKKENEDDEDEDEDDD